MTSQENDNIVLMFPDANIIEDNGGTGGGGGGMIEAKVAKLEADVSEIKVSLATLTERSKNLATKADLHSEIGKQTKWIAGTIIATAGLFLAVANYLFK